MHPGSDAELSLHRSRNRQRVLLMLSSLSEARPRQLARAVGIDCQRLKWMMHGHLPEYSEALSLIGLGLVREERDANGGRRYVITERGRRKARSLTSRGARRAEWRAWRARRAEVPDRAVPTPEPSVGAPPP